MLLPAKKVRIQIRAGQTKPNHREYTPKETQTENSNNHNERPKLLRNHQTPPENMIIKGCVDIILVWAFEKPFFYLVSLIVTFGRLSEVRTGPPS
jgi:hypothetical protein